ncbi:hypothetical protein [Nonomuraea sp. NPDC050783]|uniref:hypothetical protein n=1 Tax=Nonomuraea sp. NPDC050783 TaxID=3154634 RepID=UPI003465A2EC
MSRPKAAGRIAVAVLAVLAVLAAVTGVALVWRVLDPDDPVNRADLAAVILAALTLAGTVLVWARRSATTRLDAGAGSRARNVVDAAGHTTVDTTVDAAAQVLAALVEQQWRTEARHRLLEDPEPIPVRWQLIADETVMSQARLISADTEFTLTGRSDRIDALAGAFRGLTRRRLVITGGAGMGKTTLAVQLLLQLLATRAADQAAAAEGQIVAVPVLLPVSGWDTDAHPRLQDWLAVRLATDYPALKAPQLGAGAAAALADGGHILDGLDEIPAPARARVITALNTSLTARDQLILTTRRAEFTTAVHAAGRPLTAAAVIVPKPVTPQAAADHLTACLPATPPAAWRQVLTALRSGTAPGLTRLTATPLGLWLIRTVYLTPGADPAALLGPLGSDADALRAHLLDRLIPALIQSRPPSTDPAEHFRPRHHLDPEATRRYLTYLAHAFPPDATRDIAWWRIARTTPHIRLMAGLFTRFTSALAGALAGGLMLALMAGPGQGAGFALVFALVGLLRGGLSRGWSDDTPGYADLRLRGRTALLLHSVAGNAAYGAAVGVVGGLVVELVFGAAFGIAFAVVAGVVVTVASAVIEWAARPTLTAVSTPRSSWRADDALCRLQSHVGVLAGMLAGALAGILAGVLADGFASGLAGLLAGVLAGTLSGVLTFGNHHASLLCKVAGMRQALAGRLPRQIMDFLDDAHRLGLLRAVGPVYQFRHAALHDHLAATGPSDEPRSP